MKVTYTYPRLGGGTAEVDSVAVSISPPKAGETASFDAAVPVRPDAGKGESARTPAPGAEPGRRIGAETVQSGLGEGDPGEACRIGIRRNQPGAGVVRVVVDEPEVPAFAGGKLSFVLWGKPRRVVRTVDVVDEQPAVPALEEEVFIRLVRRRVQVAAGGGERGQDIMAGGERIALADAQQVEIQGVEGRRRVLFATFIHQGAVPEA